MKKIAVYTAIFGNYDDLLKPLHANQLSEQADFFCFTDNSSIQSDYYNVKLVERPFADPVRSNRYYKILSHLFLSEYEYVLYVDGNVQLICNDLAGIFSDFLVDYSYAVFRHSARNCLYDEAGWVMRNPKVDDPQVVKAQMERYRQEGFPQQYGLIAGTFLLRKHNIPEVQKFDEMWWAELTKGSRRDQLSFDYVRWKTRLKVFYLPGLWENNFIGIRNPHKNGLYPLPKQSVQTTKHIKRISSSTLKSVLKRFLPLSYRQKLRSVVSTSYRQHLMNKRKLDQEEKRLLGLPRYTETFTPVWGKPFKIADAPSFFFTYKEIIQKQVYKFNADTDTPFILDCGANIGLSVLYFKKLYPNSKIIAFEPDNKIFRLLEHNIRQFNLTDVQLVKKGVWNESTTLKFVTEGADAGRVATEMDQDNITVIETVRLRDYIKEKVDFLKIDIEGAELTVLEDCKEQLNLVQRLFIEYHSFANAPQNFSHLIRILEESNMRYYISSPNHSLYTHQPLVDRRLLMGMDLQLNVYAFRD